MKIKHLGWILFGFTFGFYGLIVFGMSLPYTYANTDIVLYTSVLPELLDVLMDITEIAVFALGFGIFMYACFHRATKNQKLGLVGIFSGAVLFRRLCDLLVSLIIFSAIDIENLIYAVVYLLLDLLLVWGISLFIHLRSNRYFKNIILKAKASALFKDDLPVDLKKEDLFPFKKLYSKENPLQSCALWSGIILSAVKIVSRMLYDIGYGAPSGIMEILIMVVYYGSDIALGILFYFGALFVLTRIFRAKSKSIDVPQK